MNRTSAQASAPSAWSRVWPGSPPPRGTLRGIALGRGVPPPSGSRGPPWAVLVEECWVAVCRGALLISHPRQHLDLQAFLNLSGGGCCFDVPF